MGSLSLRALLISSVLLTGIVPVVATSVYLQSQSKQAMIERSEAQLDANRIGRQEHVEHYLDMVRDQNSTLAHDLMTVEAMSGFRSAFPELGQLVDDQASAGASQRSRIRERVSGFYTSSFATEYSNRNGESIDSRGLLPTTSAGLGAQYAYIANSPYPLGEKDKLERADSGLRYDALHERYHAIYRDFLQRFGYYDIFLVEPVDGTIVYSVFKELDYGTSLFNGPYRDTNFADVTRKAMALPPGQTAIVDYKQYQPSYDAAASFVAAPIYDADVLIGVLVFQMPVDRLNSILLEETGLGETGETLLLGQDGQYRSQSRFSEANSILTATIDSPIIALASSGEAGTTTVDMDGSEYIASYASLEHAGLDWLMIARIKSSEALSVVSALQQTMLFATALVALIVSVFGFFLARWLYNKLGGDPQEILAIAEEIGAGDLSPSEDEATRTGAYKALVNMRAKLREVLGKSNQISREVQTGATELSDGNMGLSERTEQQAANLEETASSTEELTSTVRQNADNARSARDLAHETSGRATASGEVAAKAIEAMTDINSASEKISNIIGVIDEIAFQTNLLALNAAVEAARAGEQGRGFAVVATEVRQLAGRSASAAREIKDLIEDSVTKVKGGTELVQKSGDELNHIVTAISQLTEIVSEISSASEEQAAGIDQINQALIHMDSVTQQNAALVEQAAATSKSISDQSTELSSHISYFDTGVDHHESYSASTARAPAPARAIASAPVASASAKPRSSAQPAPEPVSDDGVWEEF